jgi:hypothetical protein
MRINTAVKIETGRVALDYAMGWSAVPLLPRDPGEPAGAHRVNKWCDSETIAAATRSTGAVKRRLLGLQEFPSGRESCSREDRQTSVQEAARAAAG